MSLQTKMRLAELKAQEAAYYQKRNERRESIIPEVVQSILQDVTTYFVDKGFDVSSERKGLKATYHSIVIEAQIVGDGETKYFGADFYVDFKSSKLDRSFVVLLKSDRLPSYTGIVDDEKQTAFYESVIIPALESKGVDDITGEFELFVRGKNPPLDRTKVASVAEGLDVIFKDF